MAQAPDQPDAIWRPSPNVNDRRGAALPDIIVLHYTAMQSAEAALQRLCDPAPPADLSPVSCHYLIGEDGRLWQLCPEARRAWHAGQGAWAGVGDVNSRSIGIELANRAETPFAEGQMAGLERLLPQIMARWSIPPERVIGHSDMAPLRKSDPGTKFDWRRLARQDLSVWPAPGGRDEGDLITDLRRFGYPVDDTPPKDLLAAFRQRFRPWASGPEAADDRIIARDLARRFPAAKG
ncbi:N-acetylmuramoyl-L-alanine amidase [Pseudooceanicola algae]|uniref:N-acetylmuramoyl-L-alanine amidase n=1 Tax=Pseudooceanicola algae TaxID=1537215 RepID=A0A418SI20_9RHOB|nr:N-acetylmuramoyl-L-alanine amidase [Pseudooceanicola algae]QPM92085.1 N-acetylmuramoyl-L-alanine amidase AmiD [Pseudooceanicola algae]